MLSVPVPVLAARSYINNSNEFLRFSFSQEGDKIVLDAQKCREISSTLMATHAISSITSKNLAHHFIAAGREAEAKAA